MNASHQPYAAGRPPAVEVPGASVPIRFDDGAAYERYMGLWSREVGLRFLDWLALPAGGRNGGAGPACSGLCRGSATLI